MLILGKFFTNKSGHPARETCAERKISRSFAVDLYRFLRKKLLGIRVTRLGEFSPTVWLFTLGCFLIQKRPKIRATVSHAGSCVLINFDWLGRFFSQTHLVTLLGINLQARYVLLKRFELYRGLQFDSV
jgi:hypothetical protein